VCRSAPLVALLAIGAIGASAARGSALRDLPTGWVFIPGHALDSRTGAYHDCQSGAYVNFDVASKSVVVPRHEKTSDADVLLSSEVQSVPYKGVLVADARRYKITELEQMSGVPLAEFDAETVERLPPAGSKMLHVSLFPGTREGLVWHFWSVLQTDGQRDRVQELLLSQARLRSGEWPSPDDRAPTEVVKNLASIEIGMTYEKVVSALGSPRWGRDLFEKGFSVTYVGPARPDGTGAIHQIVFSDDQRVTKVGGQ
jgi:hypothetical protein